MTKSTKHTPGPWVVGRQDDEEDGRNILIDAKSNPTAFIASALDIADIEAQEANALLISAAPDLLEALEGLLKNVELQADLGDAVLPVKWSVAAHTAISRAKGEA